VRPHREPLPRQPGQVVVHGLANQQFLGGACDAYTTDAAVYRATIPAGEPWLMEVKAGQTLRILDLEGNQAVDTLFYSLKNPRERYDVQRTLRRQNSVYLSTGSVLYSNLGQPMLTIVDDTCGRHDTLGGACAVSACAHLCASRRRCSTSRHSFSST
jgi:uncharacterized protein YcgI (DUF1989 family)